MTLLTTFLIFGLISSGTAFYFYIKADNAENKETNRRRKFYDNLKNKSDE